MVTNTQSGVNSLGYFREKRECRELRAIIRENNRLTNRGKDFTIGTDHRHEAQ